MKIIRGWIPLLILCVVFSGCATSPPEATSIEFSADQYDAMFDSTLQAIRDEGFLIDRVDRRLGVITTEARDAGSLLEPWKQDNSVLAQASEATVHHQRRVVRASFVPASPDEYPQPMSGPVAIPFEPARYDGSLRLDLQCIVERAHRPNRRIETVSLRHSSVTIDRSLSARGVPGRFWEPISRDTWMEHRLVERMQ